MSDAIALAPAGAELAAQRSALIDLWVAVTNAGGAVGFRPPVDGPTVVPVVDELLRELAGTRTRAIVARDVRGAVVGLVLIAPGPPPRFAHRVTLRRMMVHPDLQGTGVGGRLLMAAHDLAVAEFEADLALVEVRDGLGLDGFYLRHGYREVGRIPGGLRFEDGDRVDELFLLRDLP